MAAAAVVVVRSTAVVVGRNSGTSSTTTNTHRSERLQIIIIIAPNNRTTAVVVVTWAVGPTTTTADPVGHVYVFGRRRQRQQQQKQPHEHKHPAPYIFAFVFKNGGYIWRRHLPRGQCAILIGRSITTSERDISLYDFVHLAANRIGFNGTVLRESRNNYKINDFKPAFGYLFPNLLDHYDWWGAIDNDILLGDVRRLVNSYYLENFDVIGAMPYHPTWGPFTLYRNTPLVVFECVITLPRLVWCSIPHLV
jgi:hypothetical protein